MDAVLLITLYIVATMIVQGIGFLISEAVNYEWPEAGLMTFLILFMGAFWIAWPIAVKGFDWLWGDRPLRGEDEETRVARLAGKPLEFQRDLDRRPGTPVAAQPPATPVVPPTVRAP
jgi:hypothetical protein